MSYFCLSLSSSQSLAQMRLSVSVHWTELKDCLIWAQVLFGELENYREVTWWTEEVWFWWSSKDKKVRTSLGFEVWQLTNSVEVVSRAGYYGASKKDTEPCTALHWFFLSWFWVRRLNLSRQFYLLFSWHPSGCFLTKLCYLVMMLPCFGGVWFPSF